MVEEMFGPIPRGEEPERAEVASPSLDKTKVVVVHDDVPEQKLWMTWHSPPLYQPNDAELDLFSSVFGGGKDSRLYKRLVREKKIAKSISAIQMSGYLSSRYMIRATANGDHTTAELVDEIDAVLSEILNDSPPTPEEFAASKANSELHFYQAQETISGKGETLQNYNMYRENPDYIQGDLDRYLNATEDSVLEAAKATLLQPRLELHYLPNSDKKGGE